MLVHLLSVAGSTPPLSLLHTITPINGTDVWRLVMNGRILAAEVRNNGDLVSHAKLWALSGSGAPRFYADLGQMEPSAPLTLRTMDLSNDGSLFAMQNDQVVSVWRIDAPVPQLVAGLRVNASEGERILGVDFLPNSSLVALQVCDRHCTAQVFDPTTSGVGSPVVPPLPLGTSGRFFIGPPGWAAASSPVNGTTLFRIAYNKQGLPHFSKIGQLYGSGFISFSHDGHVAFGNAGGTKIYAIDGSSVGKKPTALLRDGSWDARWSPDGRFLAVAWTSPGTPIYVHDLTQSGAVTALVPDITTRVHVGQSVAMTERYLASGTNDTLRLFTPPSGALPPLSAVLLREAGHRASQPRTLCLDVEGQAAADGVALWLRLCSPARVALQTWTLHGDRMVASSSTGLCVELGNRSGIIGDGSPAFLRACNDGEAAQRCGYHLAFAQFGGLPDGEWCMGPDATEYDPSMEAPVKLACCDDDSYSGLAAKLFLVPPSEL